MADFAYALFVVNIAWLATHELDAILHHEWRMFPFLNPFDDVTAYRIFTALHIPLFALVILSAPSRGFQIGFDVFLIIHAGLHYVLRRHPKYEFHNGFSNLLIFGAAPLAALHLLVILTA